MKLWECFFSKKYKCEACGKNIEIYKKDKKSVVTCDYKCFQNYISNIDKK